jgi:hypothetical protein
MKPVVSICVPNLNTLPFLPERFETIFNQSYPNWELLVYDNFSEDGSWEFFKELARKDQRIAIAQAPRAGMYANWNNCIRAAQGEYIYIATSDDTMSPDCLEKLVAALEAHPNCDVAHCRLRTIDEHGDDTDSEWWPTGSTFARSSGELLLRSHIRHAPYDGLLHLLGPVYISVTQLLIRRSLFDRIGLYKSEWGSVGDYNWNMRAGLVANTIHVPDTWGGWRLHPAQATAHAAIGSLEHFIVGGAMIGGSSKIQKMIDDAFASCEKMVAPQLLKPLYRSRRFGRFIREVEDRKNKLQRRARIIRALLSGSAAARSYVWAKAGLLGARPWPQSAVDLVRQWLEDAGMGEVLVPV